MRIGPFEIPDQWAVTHRNVRGMTAGVVLVGAILGMLYLRRDPMVARDLVYAEVVVVEAKGLEPFGDGQPLSRVVVTLPDSSRVRVLLPPPVPHPGDQVPLLRETHKKSGPHYTPDHARWQTEPQ